MLALKSLLLSFFGWLVVLGSSNPYSLPQASYVPVDSITASTNDDQLPLFFDAIIDSNHAFTYETPPVKICFSGPKQFQYHAVPSYYPLSYYTIGQQITIYLSTKTIIFPFHCFT